MSEECGHKYGGHACNLRVRHGGTYHKVLRADGLAVLYRWRMIGR